jgi:acyl carrier protein
MESSEVYTRLTSLFRNVFDNDEIVASPELTANDVEGWDSLRHVRLMLSVERAFGIKFSAYEVNRLRNVGQLAKLIQDKLGAQA